MSASAIAGVSPIVIIKGLHYQWLLAVAGIISIIIGYEGMGAKNQKSAELAQ
jgi:hypothetical protein